MNGVVIIHTHTFIHVYIYTRYVAYAQRMALRKFEELK